MVNRIPGINFIYFFNMFRQQVYGELVREYIIGL